MKWLGIAGAVLGLWILLTPWTFDSVEAGWVSVILGVVIVTSSLVATFSRERT